MENKENQKLYTLFIFIGFIVVAYDIIVFGGIANNFDNLFFRFFRGFSNLSFFKSPLNTKFSILVIMSLVGIGSVPKKKPNINILGYIVLPLVSGILFLFGSVYIYPKIHSGERIFLFFTLLQLFYILCVFLGSILFVIGISNITKLVRLNIGKDEWNIEGESFRQEKRKIETPTSVNLPTKFYYRKKWHSGWINFDPFRGTVVIGTPGSGKTFGIINPTIRQMIDKGYSMCIYDFKFPDLANIAYYRYLVNYRNKKPSNGPKMDFKVLDLDNIENSVRVNPLHPRYIKTLAEAKETASCIVEALQKSEKASGSDSFFQKSAIDLLGACIHFLAKYKDGKYSDMPHLISLVCSDYEVLFDILYTNWEIEELLSSFYSSYIKRAFEQLEGQVGTLRVFIADLASKETYYIFSEDEFNLDISNPQNPAIFILASNPQTQDINSTFFSVVVNRISKLINKRGNLPFGLIADEVPTLYIHKIEQLIATARSNQVGVVLGLQELPQFKKQYGKDKAETIISVMGNIFSGSARNQETLNWLEGVFGKKKQLSESFSVNKRDTSVTYSEKLDNVIPKGKITKLQTGEIVGVYAKNIDNKEKEGSMKDKIPSMVHCKIDLDLAEISREEANYKPIPKNRIFSKDFDNMLRENMELIRADILLIHEEVKHLAKKTDSNKKK